MGFFHIYSYSLLLCAISICVFAVSSVCSAADYYVAVDGSDTNPGTKEQPWATVQHAADTLQAGDTVYIRSGVYRECVQPNRGGASEEQRITYKAYPGETPIIKGSERFANWRLTNNGVWRAKIPDTFFGDYNPFLENIEGDYLAFGLENHTGEVYLDGEVFSETAKQVDVYHTPKSWYATHHDHNTIIYANFGAADPK